MGAKYGSLLGVVIDLSKYQPGSTIHLKDRGIPDRDDRYRKSYDD
jgi:hypothetical protein